MKEKSRSGRHRPHILRTGFELDPRAGFRTVLGIGKVDLDGDQGSFLVGLNQPRDVRERRGLCVGRGALAVPTIAPETLPALDWHG